MCVYTHNIIYLYLKQICIFVKDYCFSSWVFVNKHLSDIGLQTSTLIYLVHFTYECLHYNVGSGQQLATMCSYSKTNFISSFIIIIIVYICMHIATKTLTTQLYYGEASLVWIFKICSQLRNLCEVNNIQLLKTYAYVIERFWVHS